jgi:hypothetical protein
VRTKQDVLETLVENTIEIRLYDILGSAYSVNPTEGMSV